MLAQELPVFKDTEDFVKKIMQLYTNFPRVHRVTLGKKLYESSLELFEYIELANRNKEKRNEYLECYLVKFNLCLCLVRLATEVKAISLN